MDTIETTVAKDALGKDIKHLASAAAADSSTSTKMNSIVEKPDECKTSIDITSSIDIDNEKKDTRAEETDDLLEKIDEAVKDKNTGSESIDNDISQSSEHDFIKKLEEIENDGKEVNDMQNKNEELGELRKECDSEKVVVGKLVMDVCSDDNKLEKSTIKGKKEIERCSDSKLNVSALSNENKLAQKPESLSNTVDDINCAKNKETTKEVGQIHNDKKEIEKKVEQKEPIKKVENSAHIETGHSELIDASEVRSCGSVISEKVTSTEINVPEKETETLLKVTKDGSKTVEIDENIKTSTEVKKIDETMSVDLIDPLSEAMDVDADEKMDIDNEIDEFNDQEMKSAPGTNILKEKSKNVVPEVEIIPMTSSTKEIIQENKEKKNIDTESLVQKKSLVEESQDAKKRVEDIKQGTVLEVDNTKLNLQHKLIAPQKLSASPKCSSAATTNVSIELSSKSDNSVVSKIDVEKEIEHNLSSTDSVKKSSSVELPKTLLYKERVDNVLNLVTANVKRQELDIENQKDIKAANREETELDSPITKSKKEINKNEELPRKTAEILKNVPSLSKTESNSSTDGSLNSAIEEQIITYSKKTTVDLEVEHQPLKKVENKPLLNAMKLCGSTSSLNTTPVTTANVFNSTPIQKQFEISSENVSKISEGTETSRTEKIGDDDGHSNKPEYTSESGTCTSTEHQTSTEHHSSDHQSSDAITKYMNVIKKCNGLTDSGTDDESTAKIKGAMHSSVVGLLSTTTSSDLKKDSLYEINVYYQQNALAYLSIENVELKKMSTGDGSEQASSSTNGSVTSLQPFILPSAHLTELSSSSSVSEKITEGKSITSTSHLKNKKISIQGLSGLCKFMIEEFTKIEKSLHPEEAKSPKITKHDELDEEDPKTPKSQTSKEFLKKNITKVKSASPVIVSDSTPSPVRSERRSRKRSFTKTQSEDEDEGKSKAKQPRKILSSKTQVTPLKEIEVSQCDLAGQCVLAKWVDKKYYAGKITADKPGNKFVVLFEDGASKVLPRDSIVFGEGDTLPLKDRYVHASVDEDYESGVVLSIEKVDEKILYTVKADTKTVKVSASDIYLTDEQAKAIQSAQQDKSASSNSPDGSSSVGLASRPTRHKRASASPIIPEAGYSGGVVKKGAKRQKRYS